MVGTVRRAESFAQKMSPSPDPVDGVPKQPERLALSVTQIAASGLAAVSATVAASFFGVAGTVIGAALGSVISVVGGAVYSYSIRTTHSRVRKTLDVAVAQRFNPDRTTAPTTAGGVDGPTTVGGVDGPTTVGGADGRVPGKSPVSRKSPLKIRPRSVAIAAGAVFVATLAVTTGFELATGQPLAATLNGKHGSGTSLTDGQTSKPRPTISNTATPVSSAPVSSTSISSVPSDSVTVSPNSPSATVTVTVTPSGSTGPTPSSSPSDEATSSDPSGADKSTPTGAPVG